MAKTEAEVLFEAVAAPLAYLSVELVYLKVNRAYERTTGRSREGLLGRSVAELFPGDEAGEEYLALLDSMERVLTDRETDIMAVHRHDVEEPGSPGVLRERYWNITNTPIFDEEGKIVGILNQPQEVTTFVRREPDSAEFPEERVETLEAHMLAQTSQLHEVNQRLRRAQVKERRVSDALRKAVQEQREAVADASHDLRGPLTGLLTRLQVALDDPDADPRETLLATLQDAERLGDIVGDLLELARLEAGVPADTEPVDLPVLVGGELVHLAPRKTVRTHLDVGVIVDASRVRLARLVGNLLANAERHAASRIEVAVLVRDRQAVLEVMDDGPGIPDPDKEAVFRRFYRRADARRLDPGGTGLGLPIARQIAESHGGTLQATDRPDDLPGACLTLRLPLHRP
ncbi:PAS domain S-box-containing protein [Actinocorallia herbida]|uniref:histidine kinase n=1 Tax=Actinocorallia herbida TaxID=58109 RepID=A0A3N1CXT8_9ACTN|nr:PAS domain-containing sensor histidine kinase [Actinocorallia herbida]ROO86113.1 PAS domain S-box-containing protein [Actinocorallia herbida]